MSKTTTLTIRIDPVVKKKVEKLYSVFGLNLSDAINMFIHQSLRVGGLPFELKDPFYRGRISIDNGSLDEETDEPTIDDLKRIVPIIAESRHIKKIYLIGSRARGDNSPDSDYYFAIEMKKGEESLIELSGLLNDLEDVVGKKVDFDCLEKASKELLDEVERYGILLYEEK